VEREKAAGDQRLSALVRAGFEPTAHGFGTVKAVGAASHSEFVKGRKGR